MRDERSTDEILGARSIKALKEGRLERIGGTTAEELITGKEFRIEDDTRFDIERARGGDGYDVAYAVEEKAKWRPIAMWGKDGWDLGNWPYVIVFHRECEGFELAYYVEGDLSTYRYPTLEVREAATDSLALFHWQGHSFGVPPGIEKYETVASLPADYRGPYRTATSPWQRFCQRSQPRSKATKCKSRTMTDGFFVYVSAGKHLWRFVWFGEALDGEQAIEQARREARELANNNSGDYMALPSAAITTRRHA